MKHFRKTLICKKRLLALFPIGLLLASAPAQAQVVPDSSLGTQVEAGGLITGGLLTSDGTSQNLFHSFQLFSPSSTDVVTFMTTPTVENVITRVTGGSASQIDGTLQLAGSSANLFLINPSGIVFGPSARLNLPGSFVVTTAESALFENGEIFSADGSSTPSLLTVSAPIGLQMGDRAADITVNNTGHSLVRLDPTTGQPSILAPHTQQGATAGLQVFPGKTLGLFGSGVTFEGGLASAYSGNLEVGSVAAGSNISLTPIPAGFAADYSSVESFETISLSDSSLLDVSGVPVSLTPNSPFLTSTTSQGRLQLAGSDIKLSDTSLLLGQSGVGATTDGQRIGVQATGTLSLLGSNGATSVRSGIFSETIGPASSGDIHIEAKDVYIDEGGGINSLTFTAANSGEIVIESEDELEVRGANAENPTISSVIATAAIGTTGQSGDITLTATNMLFADSGGAGSINFAQGRSGDVSVTADTLTLTGRNSISDIPSSLSVTNYGPGEVGSLDIYTRQLSISEQAVIGASSILSGPAGSINIVATERIDASAPEGSVGRSVISSGALIPSATEESFLGIPRNRPTGDAGSISIKTPVLSLDGPFSIFIASAGTGDAGRTEIEADVVTLRNGSSIIASTFSGEGGNIDLDVQTSLILREGSFISAESSGSGNGGNVSIASPTIIALENSDIVASAIQGQGGNITISAQNVLGTAARDRLTPQSDINASSEFGIDGTVEINNPKVDPSSGSIVLPSALLDSDQQVAAACSDTQSNQFIASGRGGLATDPRDRTEFNHVWRDVRPLAAAVAITDALDSATASITSSPLTEATGWQRDAEGVVALRAADPRHGIHAQVPSCLS